MVRWSAPQNVLRRLSGVLDKILLDQLSDLKSQAVIRDHVNLFAGGLVGHDVGQEGDELGRGVARCRRAQHLRPSWC